MNFDQARLESTRKSKYDLKRKRVSCALKFLEEYSKDNNHTETKIAAQRYIFAREGIIYHGEIKSSEITQERVENAFREICNNSRKTFISFFESYKSKISHNYQDEYINNAYEDLKEAYKLFCIANKMEFNESADIKYLESLYELLLKKEQDNEKLI